MRKFIIGGLAAFAMVAVPAVFFREDEARARARHRDSWQQLWARNKALGN
jgi:hypothetical protein